AGADVLGRHLGVVAGALDAIPGIGAVRAVVRDAIPLGQIFRVGLGRLGQRRVELQRPQALLLAVGVDHVARLVGVELRVAVVAVGQRAGRRLLERALGNVIVGAGGALGRRVGDGARRVGAAALAAARRDRVGGLAGVGKACRQGGGVRHAAAGEQQERE